MASFDSFPFTSATVHSYILAWFHCFSIYFPLLGHLLYLLAHSKLFFFFSCLLNFYLMETYTLSSLFYPLSKILWEGSEWRWVIYWFCLAQNQVVKVKTELLFFNLSSWFEPNILIPILYHPFILLSIQF